MTKGRTVIAGYEKHALSSDGLALARLLADVMGARLLPARIVTRRQDIGTEHEVDVRVHVSTSVPRGLHELAEAERADLIVLGSSHHGTVGRVLAGSIAGRLIEGASCAVAVAPRGFAARVTTLDRIGVAFDGSPESKVALHHAAELAVASGARLRLIAVVDPLVYPAFVNFPAGDTYVQVIRARREMMEQAVDEAVAGLPPGVQAATRVVEGEPVEAICKAVEFGVDLLAVGSRGWGPVRRVLLGSASTRLLRVAPCPVLVTPRGLAEEPADVGSERVGAEVAT